MRRMRKPGSFLTAAAILMLISPSPIQAATTSISVPFALINFVPCAAGGAGELVLIQGTLHIVTGLTVTPSGAFHIKQHFQPQGATGIGLTTGDVYQANGVTRENLSFNAGGLPITDTFINNFRLIAPGTGNNLQIHQTLHITINENGVVTASVANTSVSCG